MFSVHDGTVLEGEDILMATMKPDQIRGFKLSGRMQTSPHSSACANAQPRTVPVREQRQTRKVCMSLLAEVLLLKDDSRARQVLSMWR